LSHFLECMRLKNLHFSIYVAAKEGWLNCQHIRVLYNLEYHCPRCMLFIPRNTESTKRKIELFIQFIKNVRQKPALVVVCFTTVAKHVILLAVTMKVYKWLNLVIVLSQSDNLIFYGVDLWVQKGRGSFPVSVEVHSRQIASKVPKNNPINIYHRYAFDDKIVD
jgi:hypothetical protein